MDHGVDKGGPLDTTQFFQQDAFADITIKFGEREFKAHKIVLCSRSDYFRKAIGPESHFKESQQDSIDLREDDPQAFEAMLRYIYTFDYLQTYTSGNQHDSLTWKEHFDVAIVADKYGVERLKSTAFDKFIELATELQDANDIWQLFCRREDCPDEGKRIRKTVEKLCDKKFPDLFNLPDFRTVLERNKQMRHKLCSKHYQALKDNTEFQQMLKGDGELCFKLLSSFDWAHGIVEKVDKKCNCCGTLSTCDADCSEAKQDVCTRNRGQGFRFPSMGCGGKLVCQRQYWVKRG